MWELSILCYFSADPKLSLNKELIQTHNVIAWSQELIDGKMWICI